MKYSSGNPSLAPKYRVWSPERGETENDAVIVNHLSCDDSGEAAEYWAEYCAGFSGDPFREVECTVQMKTLAGWSEPLKYEVTVVPAPQFTARRVA